MSENTDGRNQKMGFVVEVIFLILHNTPHPDKPASGPQGLKADFLISVSTSPISCAPVPVRRTEQDKRAGLGMAGGIVDTTPLRITYLA